MINSAKQCLFCNKAKQKIVYSSELFFVVRDSYPVTKHHTLIIPHRHIPDFFDLSDNELNDLLVNERDRLIKMRMSHAVSPLENPQEIKFLKKDIARILTEISKRSKKLENSK